MTSVSIRICLGLILWGTGMAAALSLAQWSGDWGHGVCGPWGCGPPTQALVSCHLAWLVFLTPLAVLLLRRTSHFQRRLGLFLILVSVAGLLSVVAYEWATWWPDAGEWQRAFFWQRCGFCIATAIEFPILQTLAIGVLLLVSSLRRAQSNADNITALDTAADGPIVEASCGGNESPM